jgi:hypothetical protein
MEIVTPTREKVVQEASLLRWRHGSVYVEPWQAQSDTQNNQVAGACIVT